MATAAIGRRPFLHARNFSSMSALSYLLCGLSLCHLSTQPVDFYSCSHCLCMSAQPMAALPAVDDSSLGGCSCGFLQSPIQRLQMMTGFRHAVLLFGSQPTTKPWWLLSLQLRLICCLLANHNLPTHSFSASFVAAHIPRLLQSLSSLQFSFCGCNKFDGCNNVSAPDPCPLYRHLHENGFKSQRLTTTIARSSCSSCNFCNVFDCTMYGSVQQLYRTTAQLFFFKFTLRSPCRKKIPTVDKSRC
jgi:hypothetical protein